MAVRTLSKLGFKLAFVATSLALAGSAYAAGFAINELSPELQATAIAGAGSATNDVTAMAFNPATLATLKSSQIYLGTSYIAPTVRYSNARANIDGAPVTGINNEDSVAPDAWVPDAYIGWVNSTPVKAGLALTAPWGLRTDYDTSWVGRNNALNSSIKTFDIAPTLAMQVDKYLALGASFHAQKASVDYSNSIASLSNPAILTADLSGTSWGYGYSLGALITPVQGSNLGISYRSRIHQEIEGAADITSPITILDGSPGATASITLPDQILISGSQVLNNKWTVMASALWTHWALMNGINANLTNGVADDTTMDWRNTWFFSLGAKYQLNQRWALMGGTAYDQTPTINQYRDPRIPGSNRYWLTTGVDYQPSQNLAFDLTYEHIFMASQTISVSQSGPSNLPTTNSIYADYSGYANIIAAGVRYTF
ncbi:MAG: OmpP1/FadL family transporter [Gammaproteobacteria bacterium]|nr:OmpP1/FadL family transporter [Gammaproteobacteria bacterium]